MSRSKGETEGRIDKLNPVELKREIVRLPNKLIKLEMGKMKREEKEEFQIETKVMQ